MQVYHREEIVDAIDSSGLFSDFLVEAVAEIVCGIGRDYQRFFVLGEQSG